MEHTLLSRTEIVVMTPDRFWCQGVSQMLKNGRFDSMIVYFCHSLSAVTDLLKVHPAICAVLTEEYGDDENISDWLVFSNWVRTAIPMMQVVMLRHMDRPGVDISSHRKRQGYLDMMCPLGELGELFGAIRNGRLLGCEIPVWGRGLTPRELYILKCLCHAETPIRLGERLGITVKTISTYKATALRKLGLKRLAPLVGRYQGLISIQESYISERYNKSILLPGTLKKNKVQTSE